MRKDLICLGFIFVSGGLFVCLFGVYFEFVCLFFVFVMWVYVRWYVVVGRSMKVVSTILGKYFFFVIV